MQNGMSALPPIADMCSALAHVRFVPKADIMTKCPRSSRREPRRSTDWQDRDARAAPCGRQKAVGPRWLLSIKATL